jgi:hypothetical protein
MKMSHNLGLYWDSSSARPSTPVRRPLVPVYRVGEPLQRGRRNWPVGAQYVHGPSGHELTIFHPEINELVVQDVKSGEAEFAVVTRPSVIVLAYRFGETLPWNDVPYCWHMQPAHWRTVPAWEASPETRALLWITLVGAHDGIIHAQRGMTLAPEFTRTLHTAIRAQARMPFNADECADAVGDLLVAHPSAFARLPLAQARTIGNR